MGLNSTQDLMSEKQKRLNRKYISWLCVFALFSGFAEHAACAQGEHNTDLILMQGGGRSRALQGGAGAATLQGGTDSTTLQGGTGSTTLQGGTEGMMIEGGTQGTMLQGGTKRDGGPVTILFLLDASRSMIEKLGGDNQKMDEAKRVLQNALGRIPNDVNVGLRVFGQFIGGGLECKATALLVPPGTNNRRTILNKLRDIRPTGMTPLTYALANGAERDLARVQGKKTIILISDGENTCGPDPCSYIQTLPSRGIALKVDVLGLDLKGDHRAKNQLDCIAKSSGGKYYDADTAAKLVESISNSVSAAISGVVITPGAAKTIMNPATPEELTPIVPAQSLEDTLRNPSEADEDDVKQAPQSRGTKTAPVPAPPRKRNH